MQPVCLLTKQAHLHWVRFVSIVSENVTTCGLSSSPSSLSNCSTYSYYPWRGCHSANCAAAQLWSCCTYVARSDWEKTISESFPPVFHWPVSNLFAFRRRVLIYAQRIGNSCLAIWHGAQCVDLWPRSCPNQIDEGELQLPQGRWLRVAGTSDTSRWTMQAGRQSGRQVGVQLNREWNAAGQSRLQTSVQPQVAALAAAPTSATEQPLLAGTTCVTRRRSHLQEPTERERDREWIGDPGKGVVRYKCISNNGERFSKNPLSVLWAQI